MWLVDKVVAVVVRGMAAGALDCARVRTLGKRSTASDRWRLACLPTRAHILLVRDVVAVRRTRPHVAGIRARVPFAGEQLAAGEQALVRHAGCSVAVDAELSLKPQSECGVRTAADLAVVLVAALQRIAHFFAGKSDWKSGAVDRVKNCLELCLKVRNKKGKHRTWVRG